MTSRARDTLLAPLVQDHPVTVQTRGVCSALAITNSLWSAIIMSLALIAVLAYSNVAISLIRHQLVHSVRIIVQVTVIASGIIVVDQFLQAFAPNEARKLSVFVGLIVTNCIVLGRTESFAAHHGPLISLLDGIGNGLGYSLVLILVATIRELIGTGSLLSTSILPTVSNGGWFEPNELFTLPPSALLIIGVLIWAIRSRRPSDTATQQLPAVTDATAEHD